MTPDLFTAFDAGQIAQIERTLQDQHRAEGRARAARKTAKIQTRRAKAEAHLAEILPARFAPGESWHVISHGDIDALSYLRHALAGTTHFDHVLISTWCIARQDLHEIESWLDSGRIDQFDLYAGEIFPSQYGDEYEQAMRMAETYGCRIVIAKNHSKITLAANERENYRLVIESSANVNTNPRIEQAAIHCSDELHAFYAEFFGGLKTIDRATRRFAA